MATELVQRCLKEDDLDFPAGPPGFESFTSFKLKKVENEPSCSVSSSNSHQVLEPVKAKPDHSGSKKISRLLRRRSGINYGRLSRCCDEESDSEQLSNNIPGKHGLPKGVIRGCADCQSCQKVIARWRPEDSSRPELEEVPAFYPTEEEFRDTIRYIDQIRPKAEQFGICRIVPPSSWKPPCPLKEKDKWERSKFATRVQKVDKLQNRDAARKLLEIHSHARKKRRTCSRMGTEIGNNTGQLGAEFGFEPGPEFTLDEFQRYADYFKAQYFTTEDCTYSDPPVETIEGEYWRVVEKATEEIEVLYGADVETGVFGSGFPKLSDQGCSSSDDKYVKSGWNLNNLPRVPGSVLCYENANISGVQVPWLYLGMCFSSFCWHVEDHHLYSLNYMHFGAPKVWYGVPGDGAVKLEDAMKRHLPDLFEEQPDLLHKLVTQLSPSILKSAGVPVYRCVQNPGELVMTFPRAYHAGFNCGFNCAEAVNVAPIDWFPHGQIAVELYRQQGRKTTLSHDKLLLGAAREAVKANWELNLLRKNTIYNLSWKNVCGRDGILAKSLRERVETENVSRELICKYSKAAKMDNNFDSTTERECSVCFFDLHLSAAGCHCSPHRFACLNHAKEMCSCSWDNRFFLFRYDTAELNLLVDALEGKLSAIYRWARLDLGLALSSCISKDNGETLSQPLVSWKGKECIIEKIPSVEKGSDVVLALEAMKIPPIKLSLLIKQKNDSENRVIQRGISNNPRSTILEDDVICLSDDEPEQSNKPNTAKDSNVREIIDVVDHKFNLCDLANAALAAEGQKEDCFSYSTSPKEENDVKDVAVALSDEHNLSVSSSVEKRDMNASTVVNVGHSIKVISVDKNHQKGPRIAKVVRRIKCNVEPLEFGMVIPGNLWSNSRAIFPKGFKSRVRFINISDPANSCNYISEIVDGGSRGPLFMVYLEHCPSEVYVKVSATRCWEVVREGVNKEITKQHKLGRTKLPPLQPPGSLDGLEMFGFTSPAIVQGIEALDKNRVCKEYWRSRPLAQISQCRGNNLNPNCMQEDASLGTYTILKGLFKKANPEELHSLVETLGNNHSLVTRVLEDEIQNRSR